MLTQVAAMAKGAILAEVCTEATSNKAVYIAPGELPSDQRAPGLSELPYCHITL